MRDAIIKGLADAVFGIVMCLAAGILGLKGGWDARGEHEKRRAIVQHELDVSAEIQQLQNLVGDHEKRLSEIVTDEFGHYWYPPKLPEHKPSEGEL